jgi:hypothetical protein
VRLPGTAKAMRRTVNSLPPPLRICFQTAATNTCALFAFCPSLLLQLLLGVSPRTG